ncbi:hypothetical protein Vretimale_5346 [Volvox reticuliferus]|uniref:Nucleoplasmin-like domain-containing protein n=1 Tax=Volvox reticuliferus TaxID=1737510 RepID=A0A8J4C5M0_9CHLO|nr:hypothetical protein Vretifemale_3903 [Volvox reticuliferus]GIM00175.1 hypothetical protein Vretimale_5346 [Volvox reticuliferus]
MADAMAFWTVLLPPNGKPVEQEVESTPNVLTSIHLTGLALGQNAKEGPHIITLEYNGTKPVLCTLEAPHARQWRLDTAIDQTFRLQNWGESEVHAYGYQVTTAVHIDDESDDDEEEEEAMDGEEEEGDLFERKFEKTGMIDEELEKAVRKMKALNARRKKAAGQQNAVAMDVDTDEDDDEDEEDEDEDEESEDEEDEDEDGIPALGDLGSDDLIGVAADEDEEDEDEEEEDEEEEKPPVKVGAKRPPQTPQPEKPRKQLKQEPPKSAPPKQPPPKQKPGAKVIAVKENSKPQEVQVDKGAALKAVKPEAPKAGKAVPAGVAPAAATMAKAEASGKPAEKAKKAEETGKPVPSAKVEDKVEKKAAGGKAEKAEVKAEEKAGGKAGGKAEKVGAKANAELSKGKDKEDKKAASPKTGKKEVATPADEGEYKSAIASFIKSQGGSAVMSQVGAHVKKPDSVQNKLAGFLKKHADTFLVEGDKVSLAKK